MKNNKIKEIVKDFEKEWYEKELDMLVLIAYSSWAYKNLGHADFMATIDLETGELSKETGRLNWIICKNSIFNKVQFNLKENKIYQLKLRKRISVESETNFDNDYMVVKIIKKNVSNPRLEEIKDNHLKPVQLNEDGVGIFELDRRYSEFEGKTNWLGKECWVYLEADRKYGDTANDCLDTLRTLLKDAKQWDDKFKQYLTEELYEMTIEWNEEGVTIAPEVFFENLKIMGLKIALNGEFTCTYDSGDMFEDNYVEANGNLDGILENGTIVM